MPHSRPGLSVIVPSCVLLGLVTAAFLVLIAFAGARENVITGSILLSFGLGWGVLGFASARVAREPQLWAFVPATIMTLVGVLFFVWPGVVTHDVLGWVWPVALLALSVWIGLQCRRYLHGRVAMACL